MITKGRIEANFKVGLNFLLICPLNPKPKCSCSATAFSTKQLQFQQVGTRKYAVFRPSLPRSGVRVVTCMFVQPEREYVCAE